MYMYHFHVQPEYTASAEAPSKKHHAVSPAGSMWFPSNQGECIWVCFCGGSWAEARHQCPCRRVHETHVLHSSVGNVLVDYYASVLAHKTWSVSISRGKKVGVNERSDSRGLGLGLLYIFDRPLDRDVAMLFRFAKHLCCFFWWWYGRWIWWWCFDWLQCDFIGWLTFIQPIDLACSSWYGQILDSLYDQDHTFVQPYAD